MTDAAVQSLARIALAPPNCGLSRLNLKHVGLTDFGAECIAACLPTSGLTTLDLTKNLVGPRGGCLIARQLASSSLQVLVLTSLHLFINSRMFSHNFKKWSSIG
jgi:hypothetical protein